MTSTTTSLQQWEENREEPGLAPAGGEAGIHRVAGITATLVGTQAVTSLLGFVYWTIATRRFPVSSVGVASAATSTMQLLGSFGMLGFGTLLIARLPTMAFDRRRVLVRSALIVVTVASTALGLIVAASVGLLPSGGLRGVAGSPADAALFAVGVALTGITLVLDQAVLSAGSGIVQFERNVVASASKIGFLVILSFAGQHGGMAVYLSWTLGTLASLPVVAYRTRNLDVRIERPRWLDRSTLRGIGRAAASHHVLNLALQAPLMLFPVIITLQASTVSTGYFATVILVAGFVFVVPYAVSIGLFASAAGDVASVRQRMRVTVPFALGVSVCADLVLIPAAHLVLAVFGSGYALHGVVPLRLLVLAGLPFVIKDHFVALRRVEDRAGSAARIVLSTSVLEVAAAVGGARVDGVTGLCVGWLALMYVEAVMFAVVLALDLHRHQVLAPPRQLRRSTAGRAPAAALAPGTATATTLGDAGEVVPDIAPAGGGAARPVGAGPTFFVMCLGVGLEALASAAGNRSVTPAAVDALFWFGLVLIFVLAARTIISPRATAAIRVATVVALGMLLQLSRFAIFPTQFVFHDELAHANTLRLIQTTHGLFSANPLLPVSPFYPGLELCTAAVHDLLGLSDRLSAIVVLLACRMVMMLAIYLGFERITRSSRLAAVASLIYVCNEQFLFFNSQFSYQTLALPLALFTVYLLLRLPMQGRVPWKSMLLPFVAASATVASHHLTSMLLAAALVVWAVVERVTRGRTAMATAVGRTALFTTAAVSAWVFVPGNPVRSYLSEIAVAGFDAVEAFVTGKQSHALFNDAGYRTPSWEIAVSLASELLVVGCVALAVRAAWRQRTWRQGTLALLLTVVAVAYPIVPAGHLTAATSEITDRASGFVFLGVGFVVASWLLHRSRSPQRSGRRPARRSGVGRAVVVAGLALAFIGQTIVGSGPQWAQTPGSFLVSSDSRSVDSSNLAAAHWEAAHLAPGTRVLADRDAGLLAGSIGGLYPVTHVADGINGSPILLSPTWTVEDERLLRQLRIAYVVVDQRDATGLPRLGVYFESGEYDQDRTTPVPLAALTKFAHLRGVTSVYDNGPLVIYDVRALEARR
jgi:O-antigen/teichoic acid export membrane protein